MGTTNRLAGAVLAMVVIGWPVLAQSTLVELIQRHGLSAKDDGLDTVFDSYVVPLVPVSPGAFAAPLAVLASAGADRVDAAYAFGILAGRSGRAAAPEELAAAGQALVAMIGSSDRRTRIAGARVSGRVFAAPFAPDVRSPVQPAGLREALFALLNVDSEIDQLAAMDALGLIRETSAITSLIERYRFYRTANKRALAGGALEAVARIGLQSSVELVKELAGDKWADGRDPTALAVAFARERLLHDGSIALIKQALDDKSRRGQARGYLAELGAPVP